MSFGPGFCRDRFWGIPKCMGAAVGDYTLVRKLGTGPHGEAWLARAPDGRRVRLKRSRPTAGAVQAFERLTDAWTRFGRRRPSGLEVPVATVLPDPSNRFAVVTEWSEAPPAEDLLDRDPLKRLEQGFELGLSLGRCLSALHAAGGAHGSIRPSNVLWDGKSVQLVDFFWAQAGWDHDDPYVAPEVAYEERPTPEADQWAWARLVAGLLEGTAADPSRFLEQARHPDPHQRFVDMAAGVRALEAAFRALRTDDVDRAQTEDLQGASADPTLAVPPPRPVPARFADGTEERTESLGPDRARDAPEDPSSPTEALDARVVEARKAAARRRASRRSARSRTHSASADPTTQLPHMTAEGRARSVAVILWSVAVGLLVAAAIIYLFWESRT